MDDYLEEILDDIDFEQELLAALDDDGVCEQSDAIGVLISERILSDMEVSKHLC